MNDPVVQLSESMWVLGDRPLPRMPRGSPQGSILFDTLLNRDLGDRQAHFSRYGIDQVGAGTIVE